MGAGIAGLAHAYAEAKRGRRVIVFERSAKARGASVRNFGLIWPIGQPAGPMLEMALHSRRIWQEALDAARLPCFASGSLHLAYHADERAVAQEFAASAPANGYDCRWLEPEQAASLSAAANPSGLGGALYSTSEMTVDPRLTLAALPAFLEERYGVRFRFQEPVLAIRLPLIETSRGRHQAGRVLVCNGDDFETLYPDLFAASGITRCKLQMMRTSPQPGGWRLGPALAAGLTLRFYSSFRVCAALPALELRIAREMPDYERWGIHVMASQTAAGEITIGDSHEYGPEADFFDKPEIDRLILEYLATFARFPHLEIAQRWHGFYARHPVQPYWSVSPEDGVQVVTALGGAGMTLSFGLAETIVRQGAA